jgi:uncharacterized protein YjbJ (UPF0337 family)
LGAHTRRAVCHYLVFKPISVAAASFANDRAEGVCKSLDAETDAKVTPMFQIRSVGPTYWHLMTRARAIPLFALSFQETQLGWGARSVIGGGILRSFAPRCILELPPKSSVITDHQKRRKIMDREHVKGAAEKAKGAIKDTAGKITGDKELQTEGKLDKAKGEAHNIAGDVKDAVRKAGK